MANSFNVYLTHSDKEKENSFKIISFKENLSLEEAVNLANGLFLTTDNPRLMITVREKDSSVPQVVFHKRDSE